MSETGRKALRMGKTALPASLVILTLLLISGVASAATRVVNQTAPPCFTSPEGFYYPIIQAAIDAASEGDTIIVCPGTYNENIWINKSLTVQSHAGRVQTIIQSAVANLNVVTIRDATEVTLDDFTICDAWSEEADVAGIFMDNVSKSTIANNLVINITDQIAAYGIAVNNSNNNSFITNSVTNISGGLDAAGIVLGASPNNSFSATSVKNVSANGLAYGIVLAVSENNTFDTTEVSYIYSSGLVDGGNFNLVTEYDQTLDSAMACGIFLVESHFNSFNDRTKVSYVMAEGDGEALGILLLLSSFNNFNDDTDVSYITATGSITALQASGDLFAAEPATLEDFEQVLDGSIACGIKLALASNNTFSDKVDVTYINATGAACGIVLYILADNNEFLTSTISDLYSASPDTTFGVFMLLSGDNLFAEPKISAGNGPLIDCGIFLGWSWNNTIQDGEVADSMVGVLLTALGIQPVEGQTNCYNTIAGNWIHENGIGIWLLYEWENDIRGNTIEENGDGVLVSYSWMNSIEENMIRNNKNAATGAHLDGNSTENELHLNCFITNSPQAMDLELNKTNDWEGNYWSDWNGVGPYTFNYNQDSSPLYKCPLEEVPPPNITDPKVAVDMNGPPLLPGDVICYTAWINNTGSGSSTDNPGNEFEDPIPDYTTYINGSATASSGTIEYNEANKRIIWNGVIPANGLVELTFCVTVDPTVPPETTISNQGVVNYDSDGDGINDAQKPTDDPDTPPFGDPTELKTAGPPPPPQVQVPGVTPFGVITLASILATIAAGAIVRKRR